MNYKTKVTVKHYRIDDLNKPECTKGKPPEGLLYRYRKVTNENILNFFYPATRGGKTEVTIQLFDEHGDPVIRFVGIALCSLSDGFCYKRGREIAMGRALKLYDEWHNNNVIYSIHDND